MDLSLYISVEQLCFFLNPFSRLAILFTISDRDNRFVAADIAQRGMEGSTPLVRKD
jgi:hypothetical protein